MRTKPPRENKQKMRAIGVLICTLMEFVKSELVEQMSAFIVPGFMDNRHFSISFGELMPTNTTGTFEQ